MKKLSQGFIVTLKIALILTGIIILWIVDWRIAIGSIILITGNRYEG